MDRESMYAVPAGERVHIGFFGIRNAGKSSLVNAVTNQALSIVSDTPGTTTDPVRKAMEILPLGPVVIVDTPGIDDVGVLGAQRVEKTREVLRGIDIAVLVVDAVRGLQEADRELIDLFEERKVPYILALNKADLLKRKRSPLRPDEFPSKKSAETRRENRMADHAVIGQNDAPTGQNDAPNGQNRTAAEENKIRENEILVSARAGEGIEELKERLGSFAKAAKKEKKILADLVKPGDTVVLVIPIDASAPKGRIILPQQMVLRELLDLHCRVLCLQPQELREVFVEAEADGGSDRTEAADHPDRTTEACLKKTPSGIDLVITDSQVFEEVGKTVPENVRLTSFSILMARYKGSLTPFLAGARKIAELKDGDHVLIAEGCTHHRQCEDIGTKKLPDWIRKFSGVQPVFHFTQGREFPEDLSRYALVVHCGGCMLGEAEMQGRVTLCKEAGVPVVNYGIAIAQMKGILPRAIFMQTQSQK